VTPEETQAALLADWLQSPPGTPAPEGIDEAVLAAVYTLRPDLAPPVRLTLDDILSAVTEGPFAATTGAVGATAAARKTGARAATVTRSPLRRAARAWWAVPGIGIVVTAAAAALIAIKVGGGLDTPSPEVAMFSEPSAPKVAEAPAAAPAEPGADENAAPSGGAFDKAPASVIAEAARAPAPAVADAVSNADAKANTQATATAAPLAATSTPAAPPPAPSVTGGTLGTADAQERSSFAGAEAPVANGPAGDVADDAGGRSYQAAEPRAESEEISQALAKRDSKSAKDERERAPAKSSAPARGASASTTTSAPEALDEDAPPTAAPAPTGGSATALDYKPGFYTSYPEITAAYSAAMAAQSAGRYSDALAAYAGFRVSPRADVAQDASWRAAQCLRSLGRIDDALAVVVSGLRVSSSNTPFRSNLYSLEGELYSAQGKASEAQRAWAEAARLNALR